MDTRNLLIKKKETTDKSVSIKISIKSIKKLPLGSRFIIILPISENSEDALVKGTDPVFKVIIMHKDEKGFRYITAELKLWMEQIEISRNQPLNKYYSPSHVMNIFTVLDHADKTTINIDYTEEKFNTHKWWEEICTHISNLV